MACNFGLPFTFGHKVHANKPRKVITEGLRFPRSDRFAHWTPGLGCSENPIALDADRQAVGCGSSPSGERDVADPGAMVLNRPVARAASAATEHYCHAISTVQVVYSKTDHSA